MNAPSARVVDNEIPEDLRFPSGFVPAPLDVQIEAARAEVHRWRNANLDATQRQRGHGAMHWNTYTAGLHKRRSVLFTLLQLKRHKEQPE